MDSLQPIEAAPEKAQKHPRREEETARMGNDGNASGRMDQSQSADNGKGFRRFVGRSARF
jgi:hypothetical protein